MPRLISLSASLFFVYFLLFGFQTSFTSCTKTTTRIDTVTLTKIDTTTTIKTDTVSAADTTLTLQILTSNTWIIQYIRSVTDNTIVYYTRGGSSTENFDAEYLLFNSNLTGTLVDPTGASHTMTWSWSNATNTQLTFITSNPSPEPSQTTIWDNLRMKGDSLLCDQYFTYLTVNSQSEVVMIPQ